MTHDEARFGDKVLEVGEDEVQILDLVVKEKDLTTSIDLAEDGRADKGGGALDDFGADFKATWRRGISSGPAAMYTCTPTTWSRPGSNCSASPIPCPGC